MTQTPPTCTVKPPSHLEAGQGPGMTHAGKTVIWKHGSAGQPGAQVSAGLKSKRHRRPEGVRAAGHSLPSVSCLLSGKIRSRCCHHAHDVP